MNQSCTCGCCEGVEQLTPTPTANRPGLTALSYRTGTHATFFETMKARLSSLCLGSETDCLKGNGLYPLRKLTTRDPADPAIALLDSWAVVADVLTFYQERVANEGFLRTATERRSVSELARLIGYTLRPGVAASVYLAYTLDEDRSTTPPTPTVTSIPKGSRVQSLPGPGELPQPFETSDDLAARSEWNKLPLRMTRPQTEKSIKENGLYLKGINTQLKPNDGLLIDFEFGGKRMNLLPVRVVAVDAEPEADRTHVTLRLWHTVEEAAKAVRAAAQLMEKSEFSTKAETDAAKALAKILAQVVDGLDNDEPKKQMNRIEEALLTLAKTQDKISKFEKLAKLLGAVITELELARESLVLNNAQTFQGQRIPAATKVKRLSELLPSLQRESSIPPATRFELPRTIETGFAASGDGLPRALSTLRPNLSSSLYQAWGSAFAIQPAAIRVYAFRVTAPLFGYNAPKKPLKFNTRDGSIVSSGDWPIIEDEQQEGEIPRVVHEEETVVNLDTSYEKILPGSWVMVETSDTKLTKTGLLITQAQSVNASGGRGEYGMTGKTTRIALGASEGASPEPTWIQLAKKQEKDNDFDAIRRTTVFAQAEELELAEEPIETPIGHCENLAPLAAVKLELRGLHDGLDTGRWLIVSGERIMEGTSGVIASELVMLAGVENDVVPGLPGDRTHTFLTLAGEGLAYCYKRDTVTIYANVVNATHGETRIEPANGDARKAFQEFVLKQPPLTHVSAANPSGAESTLQLRVNDVLWHETDSLAELEPTDRNFVSRMDDEGKTTAISGDGRHGARMPTGQENVKLIYRNGIGKPGNVKARQISLLVTRPLNVKDVINPLPASGGADKENRDLARVNAPLAVLALDRLVSTPDYADFARTFAGIGKASAARLPDGQRQLVHVTIAGADDIPILESSDLFRNLRKALHESGDPHLPVQLVTRNLLLLVLQASVRVLPDYLWEKVEPKVRAALLDKFSFHRRDLGQDALLSEVFSAIQAVEGVAYVDVDAFDGLDEAHIVAALATNASLAALIQLRNRVCVAPARVLPEATEPEKRIQPAQLAYFTPDVPDTIILNEVKP